VLFPPHPRVSFASVSLAMARFLSGEDSLILTHRCVDMSDRNPWGVSGMLQSIWPPAGFIKHLVDNLKQKKSLCLIKSSSLQLLSRTLS